MLCEEESSLVPPRLRLFSCVMMHLGVCGRQNLMALQICPHSVVVYKHIYFLSYSNMI